MCSQTRLKGTGLISALFFATSKVFIEIGRSLANTKLKELSEKPTVLQARCDDQDGVLFIARLMKLTHHRVFTSPGDRSALASCAWLL